MRVHSVRQLRFPWLKTRSALSAPYLMARTTGGLFALSGALGATITALLPQDSPEVAKLYPVAFGCILIGIALVLWGRHLRLVHFELLSLVGTAMLSGAIGWSPTSTIAQSMSAFSCLIALNAAFFFPWLHAIVLMVVQGVASMAILGLRDDLPWWIGLAATSSMFIVGGTVGVLGRMASDADIDPLTGLANRRGFRRGLNIAIARGVRSGVPPVIAFLDLDRFKAINDEYGHRAGDDMLRQVAEAWKVQVGRDDLLARYGGDEFALLMPNATERDAVELTARLRAAISLGCTAGVAAWHPGDTTSVLVGRADVALYRAKQAGRNRTMLESKNPSVLADELRAALAQDLLDVHYQPIFSIPAPSRIVGIEALVRFPTSSQPDTTLDEAIRVAEQSDLIRGIDMFVLRHACTDAVALDQSPDTSVRFLHVNVSGLVLADSTYSEVVADILAATGWPADRLVLEVTETALDAETPSAFENICRIRKAGSRIAIDDFGTGYSSLSRLETMPVDMVKLDGSFVRSITEESGRPRLLAGIASLCAALNMPVVVEGVETAYQAAVLADLGYSLAQGFHLGRPVPAAELSRITPRGLELHQPSVPGAPLNGPVTRDVIHPP
ncbi:bifunctional diguanylate cyclase/phosphodiesterase [Nocardiaceae bacterium YC2-7]|uniref:Bifunctional diguanylate cyclase/phosphodiesterase n=2 Tax=Antrihabitans stalactiti TaxID=2584121 RepID=A0A848K4N9_9NOCA|nr:bifunctional diguanylate cyclase/phosphodiesterase [Antrihabitans stalactiti]